MTLIRSYKRGIGRVYYEEENPTVLFPSVTTILNATLAKGPWLDKWKLRITREKFSELYEAAVLKESYQSIPAYDILDEALAHPIQYRDAAGDVGTQYHHAIEAYFNPDPNKPPLETYIKEDSRVKDVLKSVAEWEKKQNLEPIAVEQYIASPRYGFAGTIDLVAHTTRENGKELVLVDWKTGSTQEDQLLQLAAYAMAWQENNGKRPNVCFFCKIDVEKATVKEVLHIHYHEISMYFDLFLAAFKIWRWRQLKQF